MSRRQQSKPDWPVVALAVAAQLPHTALHPGALLRALAEHRREKRLRRNPARWAVAFSGGADSLALLLVLWAEGAGRWGRDFVVLHFNHRLRGKASDRDESFCREICAALGVAFVSGRWEDAPKQASEASAREARLDFIRREMKRRKLRLLWLAHQQDDVAESMLMRLARGSGAGGLAAPRPVQEVGEGILHLRPFLTLSKSVILAALRSAGATWREDSSNATDAFFRNRIRHTVLPRWVNAAGRDAVAGAARSRELLEEDDSALEGWLDQVAPLRGSVLDLRRLAGQPRALLRRALHRWMLAVRPATDLSRQGFEVLLGAVAKGQDTRFSLGVQGFAVVKAGKLYFRKALK